jgi:hypothetical protein
MEVNRSPFSLFEHLLLFAAKQAFSLNPAKKQCGYLFDGSSSLYNYAGEYARVQDGLEVRHVCHKTLVRGAAVQNDGQQYSSR